MIDPAVIDAFAAANHGDPFAVLGMHEDGGQLVVRVFRPGVESVTVLDPARPTRQWPGQRLEGTDFFVAVIGSGCERFSYELCFKGRGGASWTTRDPYSFGPLMGTLDLYLIGEGAHWQLYDVLGAHLTTVDGVGGTVFRVWAPNARRVSVVGDFNDWDGRVCPMRKYLESGVWEVFVPGVGEGAHYKFELLDVHGHVRVKSDPFAFYSQNGVQTASLVYNLGRYVWRDEAWMGARAGRQWQHEAVSVYEVHVGSWRRGDGNRQLSWRELAACLLPYVAEMGYTHVELLPVAEHPFEGSWGYQVTGYFAPTSRFGSPDDFRFFVDEAHRLGIGVILDWVPAHFPKDESALGRFDGTALYEHADPRQGEHQDWGTLIFNFGRNEVRNFLIANALFWLAEYHIDGLRVDAVASMLYLDYSRSEGQWVPNAFGGRENLDAISFLKRFNEVCYERHPGIMTIAEESTAWPMVSRPTYLGGLGFGFKWNMGWMHDSLRYMARDPLFRRYHHNDITFSLLYAFHEHFALVLSHDEVVHGKGSMIGKMPGDLWQKFANLRMFYAWMFAHPGKKLLFMGGEFGQWREWNHDVSLDWHLLAAPEHAGLRQLVQDLNHLYRAEPAMHELDSEPGGFEWIDCNDSDSSVVAFQRRARNGETLVFVINATPVVRECYRIGVDTAGFWSEILNTDAALYHGSNLGNLGGIEAEPTPWHGRKFSLPVRLPPLALVGFKLA